MNSQTRDLDAEGYISDRSWGIRFFSFKAEGFIFDQSWWNTLFLLYS